LLLALGRDGHRRRDVVAAAFAQRADQLVAPDRHDDRLDAQFLRRLQFLVQPSLEFDDAVGHRAAQGRAIEEQLGAVDDRQHADLATRDDLVEIAGVRRHHLVEDRGELRAGGRRLGAGRDGIVGSGRRFRDGAGGGRRHAGRWLSRATTGCQQQQDRGPDGLLADQAHGDRWRPVGAGPATSRARPRSRAPR
jgi:hypothetical protein